MKEMALADYDVDSVRGFLPSKDPLVSMGDDHFAPWEQFVSRLPKLIGTQRVRRHILTLPCLDTSNIRDVYQLNRAMTLLSYLGHAYIWGEEEVVNHIPANIAVPWHKVAVQLGRPPVLSYASHALFNWRLIDESGPIELGNLERLENFYGGIDEDWFVLIHVAIEAKAGPAIGSLIEAQKAIVCKDNRSLRLALIRLKDALAEMVGVLSRMPENCDPYVYYYKMRRYIFGWINPLLPEGVFYDGVECWKGQPQKFRGETGAQSAIIPAIDAMLGVQFDTESPFYRHLVELRDYMPPKHRRFIEDLEANAVEARLRDHVLSVRFDEPELVEAYNQVLEQNSMFRCRHLEFANDYIHVHLQNKGASTEGLGTGGTPFMKYLRQHQNDVLNAQM